jgi:hypothetical protein
MGWRGGDGREGRDGGKGVGSRDEFITHQIAFLPRAEIRREGFGTSLWRTERVANNG